MFLKSLIGRCKKMLYSSKAMQTFATILFYKYVSIDDTASFLERERAVCEVLGLTGRVIIASEGINATLEGTTENIAKYRAHIVKDKRFKYLDIKETAGSGQLFPRLSIKVRDEIVTSHLGAEINPRKDTGTYLEPEELKAWYRDGKEFEIIDMRNDYEYGVGHFKNARPSGMQNFKDISKIAPEHADLKDKTVVTVCTGGVRCEKASAYLKNQGFTNVYQLHGGIHRYMEKFPGEDFLGTLYTFDGRVTMDFGGDREIIGTCALCSATSERFADCLLDSCGAHFIACDACRDKQGRAACKAHQRQIA